ncbi:MAG TPA: SctK family type III secretion system sorting platform protein, partial [Steroidobacteraceae bacterium]
FNIRVARFAHHSWFEEVAGIRPTARTELWLSRWLLQESGLDHEMDWEMSEPQKRLWLLDAPSLQRLAQELALTMHREWVLQLIDARRLRVLEESVGAGAVNFVIGDLPEGQYHHAAPQVDFDADSPAGLTTKLREVGARTLMGLLSPEWRAVRGRAQLYFERFQRLGEVVPCEPAQRQQALALICEWLIPRRFAEWAWCF